MARIFEITELGVGTYGMGGTPLDPTKILAIKDDLNAEKDVLDGVSANNTASLNISTIAEMATTDRVGRTSLFVKDLERGGMFFYEASGYTANGGTVFDALGGGYWVRNFTGLIDVKWFNVGGDGIVDDTASIQSALDVASESLSGLRLVENGKHKITSDLNIDTENGGFLFDFNGSSIYTYASTIYFRKGTSDSFLTTTASDMYKGDGHITVASIAGVEVGDLIKITSPVEVANSVTLFQYYVISFLDSTSGNKVYIENPVVGDVTAQQIIDDGKTGDVEAEFFKMSKNMVIRNGNIYSDKEADNNLVISDQNNIFVENLNGYDTRRNGIIISQCGNTFINNCQSYRHGFAEKDSGYVSPPTAPDGTNYGYGFITYHSAYTEYNNCKGGSGWHTFDVARGQTIVKYNNCSVVKDAYGFSTHEGCWNVIYNNCSVFGGSGITARCVNLFINGGYYSIGLSHGIAVNDFQLITDIRGIVIDFNNKSGAAFLYSTNGTTSPSIGALSEGQEPSLFFENNVVLNAEGSTAYFYKNGNVSVKNNFFQGSPPLKYIAKNIITQCNSFTGGISSPAINISPSTLETLNVSYNVQKNGFTGSNSAFVLLSGTAPASPPIIDISDNNTDSSQNLIRFLCNSLSVNRACRNIFKLRIGLASSSEENYIMFAEDNISIDGTPVTVFSMDPPVNYFLHEGTTAQRPVNKTLLDIPNGFEYFDTTLDAPVWWKGSSWHESMAATGSGLTSANGSSITGTLSNRSVITSDVSTGNVGYPSGIVNGTVTTFNGSTNQKTWSLLKERDTNALYIQGYTSGGNGQGWIRVGVQSAVSSNTATSAGATYSQSQVESILTELRDLKTKMRTAGLLAT